jgi:hypothetical protein
MKGEQLVFPFDPRSPDEMPSWLMGESYVDFLRRRGKYLRLHPDECNHCGTSFGPHDGEGTEWYERCSDCLTRITPEIRDKFVDF